MRRTAIESNIPEGTRWPDLDDGQRVRMEQYVALVDEAFGRPFATLKDTEAEMVNGEPVWSARNQWASYAKVRARADPFASQWAGITSPFTHWGHGFGTRDPKRMTRLE